ncbi:MAG: hypothetical protein WKF30_01050 [Pyrinomonadaceae bacterium]
MNYQVRFIQPGLLLACLLLLQAAPAHAQARKRLPSPEKIVGEYLKAIGGKKRVASVKDVVYEWSIEGADTNSEKRTTARTQLKFPAAWRTDVMHPDGEVIRAASPRSAWAREANGDLRTLTDNEAFVAKLRAALEAGALLNYKKLNVLARTAAVEQEAGEAAYVVEFATREGARLRYWFGASSKLILKIADPRQGTETALGDYQPRDGLLEPHRMTLRSLAAGDGSAPPPTIFTLQSARYNTNLPDTLFDPPSDAAINIPQLLREVASNQNELDERISEYTYTRKQIDREINDRGELKREKVLVYEIYPVQGGGRVLKLISENGAPLAAERVAKEEKRVAEELAKAEREHQKALEKREQVKRRANETGAGKDGDEEFEGIGAFLRACEFVAPRREMLRGRVTIVFDFRPRAGYRPRSRGESLISKLIGVAWIDPEDKQVMRLEARLADGFKIGGGLLASVRSGSAFAFEQARMTDGVWLPRFAQINASVKVFLVAGIRLDATREYSDYKSSTCKPARQAWTQVKRRSLNQASPLCLSLVFSPCFSVFKSVVHKHRQTRREDTEVKPRLGLTKRRRKL